MLTRQFAVLIAAAVLFAAVHAAPVLADPCGMVPPIYVEDTSQLARVGHQQTYVFFKDGVETFVIRPGFTGNVEEFGMLIPFPTPPAVRKMPDDIFAHVAAAIDPPEVVVYAGNMWFRGFGGGGGAFAPTGAALADGLALRKDEVRVLREEAVGMYEVAVLEAGSSAALKRWMEDHEYKYPEGMDKVCDDYVESGWCFVAVKTKVGPKAGVEPKPGMRRADTKLPSGSSFDGHVQAMGFRFRVDELVVPMRLSAFNEGELRNIVYLLTDGPKRIRSIPEEYVVRQISGRVLYGNVSRPLPLRVIGGTLSDVTKQQRQALVTQRDPLPKNGHARDLFASDLLAARGGPLSHPHEEAEKALLRIGERLELRGPQIDAVNLEALQAQRDAALKEALEELKQMTLTVIDGDFPREVLAGKNLAFAEYRMPTRRNRTDFYDAKTKGPAARQQGKVYRTSLRVIEPAPTGGTRLGGVFGAGLLAVAPLGLVLVWRRRVRHAVSQQHKSK